MEKKDNFAMFFVQRIGFFVICFFDAKKRCGLFFCNAQKDYFIVKRGHIKGETSIYLNGYRAEIRAKKCFFTVRKEKKWQKKEVFYR